MREEIEKFINWCLYDGNEWCYEELVDEYSDELGPIYITTDEWNDCKYAVRDLGDRVIVSDISEHDLEGEDLMDIVNNAYFIEHDYKAELAA